jgi:hypothetical protein
MLRPRAVRALLLDVAALRQQGREAGAAGDDVDEAALRQAARRALLVAAIDALAIVLLFLLRDRSRPFLGLDRSPESVFTIGVLVVAVHLGFRLAQYLQLQRVRRALEALPAETAIPPSEATPSR